MIAVACVVMRMTTTKTVLTMKTTLKMMMMTAVVKALTILRDVLLSLSSTNHNTALRVTSRMWIAKFDVDEGNRTLADKYV